MCDARLFQTLMVQGNVLRMIVDHESAIVQKSSRPSSQRHRHCMQAEEHEMLSSFEEEVEELDLWVPRERSEYTGLSLIAGQRLQL